MRRLSLLAVLVAVFAAMMGTARAQSSTVSINQQINTRWFKGTVTGSYDLLAHTGSFVVDGKADLNKDGTPDYNVHTIGAITTSTSTAGTLLYTVNGTVEVAKLVPPVTYPSFTASGQASTLMGALYYFVQSVNAGVQKTIGLG